MSSIRICLVSMMLMFTIACGSGSSSPSSPSPDPSPTPSGPASSVSIPMGAAALTNTAFSPDLADVAVGTTVTWTNTDSVPHTSTSNATVWNSGTVAPGGRFAFTFQTAGTFSYHCAIHPGMVGTVIVR
jgi:plastocyanin